MSDEDPDAIWRSDDVPVRPWPAVADQLGGGPRTPTEEIVFERLTGAKEPSRRGRVPVAVFVAAAIAAAVALAAIVGIVVSGSDEPATPAVTEPTTAPADTLVDEPVERTDAPTTTTSNDVVSFTPETIDLPPTVAAIREPTEVLALAPSGLLHTVSLPSGRVRTVDLNGVSDDFSVDGFGSVVVTPDSAAVGVGGSRMIVVPRSGEAIDVDLGATVEGGGTNVEGWVRGEDGSTRFVVTSYPPGGDVESLLIGTDGVAVALPTNVLQYRFGPTSALQGELVVNDAGGAYRVLPDGTSQRIENGVVYSHDGRHRLVRECDERQQCSTVLVTEADGARRVIDPAVVPDDFGDLLYGVALSPDGSAASALRSTTQQPQRVIVDFGVGEVASAPSDTWTVGSTWAADSSGVFDLMQGGLHFVDRATGESVEFGDELGSFVAIGVRRPDAELPGEPLVALTGLTTRRPVGPTGLVLSAAGRTGGIGLLSVDALELATWQSPLLGRGQAVLAPSGDAVLALPGSGEPAFLTTPEVDTTLGESFATRSPMLVGPSDDTIWVPDDSAPPTDVRYRLLRFDGVAAEDLGAAVVDLADATLLGSDGRGGLVVERRGDVFVAGVDGAVRLTSGELIAIGASTAYVRECESVVDCAVIRIDRTSDARTPASADPVVLDALRSVDTYRGAALGSTVSPDGDVLVSRLDASSGGLEPTAQTVLLDSRTGELTFLERHIDDQPLVWNDDSTFAALLAGSAVHVYDRSASQTIELEGAGIRAIGPAPVDQTPDA